MGMAFISPCRLELKGNQEVAQKDALLQTRCLLCTIRWMLLWPRMERPTFEKKVVGAHDQP